MDILAIVSDGELRSIRELREALAQRLQLSDEQQSLLLPSGKQRVWDSRVGWAKTYLVKGGLLSQPARGFIKVTTRGLEVLSENPKVLDDKFLSRFTEFTEFVQPDAKAAEEPKPLMTEQQTRTPEETMEFAYQQIRQQLEKEMLSRIMLCSASFFEQLVVDLLLKMGYGGSRLDAGQAIGQSGDGGIDGIIKEDRLGLDTLYIQAKRWQAVVGRPEVQRFAGALQGQRARKGIMITTSNFSRDAHDYVSHLETKIVLIDGRLLTQLMFEHGLGCATHSNYELKQIDGDYFESDLT